jgi:hypothetical protein
MAAAFYLFTSQQISWQQPVPLAACVGIAPTNYPMPTQHDNAAHVFVTSTAPSPVVLWAVTHLIHQPLHLWCSLPSLCKPSMQSATAEQILKKSHERQCTTFFFLHVEVLCGGFRYVRWISAQAPQLCGVFRAVLALRAEVQFFYPRNVAPGKKVTCAACSLRYHSQRYTSSDGYLAQ